jgi:hypothetical protein
MSKKIQAVVAIVLALLIAATGVMAGIADGLL